MLIKSALITSASGSIGGLTASHNRGGQYFRARAIPTNPNSEAQVAVRTAMANLVARWKDVLTVGQRDAWRTYAENTVVTNPVGDIVTMTGQNAYLRGNVARVRAGLSPIDDGPTTFGLPDLNPVEYQALAPASGILTFDDSQAWVNNPAAALIVQLGPPVSPAINFFAGPFRLAGSVLGDSGSPPTSPASIDPPEGVAEGQKIFARASLVDAEGRLSSAQIVQTIIDSP